MKLLFLILVFPALAIAAPVCEKGNALPESLDKAARLLGVEWAKNATFCNLGLYQVLVPSKNDMDAILLMKNGKIFLLNQKGYGINLFQDYGRNPIPFITVQDWNEDGIYERLDYLLIGEDGNVVGNAQDKDLSGKIEVIRYKNLPNQPLQATPKSGAPER